MQQLAMLHALFGIAPAVLASSYSDDGEAFDEGHVGGHCCDATAGKADDQ